MLRRHLFKCLLIQFVAFTIPRSSANTPRRVRSETPPTPTPEEQRVPAETIVDKRQDKEADAFEKIADAAGKSNELVLLLIGGSLGILVGSSYLHPKRNLRLIYLLFPVGWVMLGRSIFHGFEV